MGLEFLQKAECTWDEEGEIDFHDDWKKIPRAVAVFLYSFNVTSAEKFLRHLQEETDFSYDYGAGVIFPKEQSAEQNNLLLFADEGLFENTINKEDFLQFVNECWKKYLNKQERNSEQNNLDVLEVPNKGSAGAKTRKRKSASAKNLYSKQLLRIGPHSTVQCTAKLL
ncbi:hypothetical protein AOXY_G30639 [Acipenser oxyrinchus oxyrinchus]|uniref:Uncharacterized protein n=1 Tax=Acipenser oxyrinchus oxyrinchus TaxID=40147 RepID=A0AAD8FT62_ACIOX|nr:hypothetical protein AOXY_G30639 [Acipenser oxyrinchus oxyrinchus]